MSLLDSDPVKSSYLQAFGAELGREQARRLQLACVLVKTESRPFGLDVQILNAVPQGVGISVRIFDWSSGTIIAVGKPLQILLTDGVSEIEDKIEKEYLRLCRGQEELTRASS